MLQDGLPEYTYLAEIRDEDGERIIPVQFPESKLVASSKFKVGDEVRPQQTPHWYYPKSLVDQRQYSRGRFFGVPYGEPPHPANEQPGIQPGWRYPIRPTRMAYERNEDGLMNLSGHGKQRLQVMSIDKARSRLQASVLSGLPRDEETIHVSLVIFGSCDSDRLCWTAPPLRTSTSLPPTSS